MAKANLTVTTEKKCLICGTTTDNQHSGECTVCTNNAWAYICKSHANLILNDPTCPVCEVDDNYNEKEQRWKSEIHSFSTQRKILRWFFVFGLLIGSIIFIQLFNSGFLQSRIVQNTSRNILDLNVQLESANRELETSRIKLKTQSVPYICIWTYSWYTATVAAMFSGVELSEYA